MRFVEGVICENAAAVVVELAALAMPIITETSENKICKDMVGDDRIFLMRLRLTKQKQVITRGK